MEHVITLEGPAGAAPVLCGDDVGEALRGLWSRKWRRAAIIGDDTTSRLFAPTLERALAGCCESIISLSFPPGEQHKTRRTKAMLEDALLEARIDRQSCVIAVGGGIALDVAGFVASTTLRGLPHINIATTLLAQVDAAIGGKTGVNTPAGKNLVGSFHHPRAVLLYLGALASLPVRQLRCGWAEAVKHGWIADAGLFADVERWANVTDRRGDAVEPLVPPRGLLARCVGVKARVVQRDALEGGYRRVLNAGHTIAHAAELASAHQLFHGEAVSVGLVVEAEVARRRGAISAPSLERLRNVLSALGLPIRCDLAFDALLEPLHRDKKNQAGEVHCALPREIGAMEPGDDERYSVAVGLDELAAAWRAMGNGPAEGNAPCSA